MQGLAAGGGRARRAVLFAATALLVLVSSAPAQADYEATVLADDPSVYLRLGDATGSTVRNLGSHDVVATVHGDPERRHYGALADDDTGDRAMRFEGEDYIDVRPAGGTSLTGPYTLEGWVRSNPHYGGEQFIFGGPDAMIKTWEFRGPGWSPFSGPAPGRWSHVVATYDGVGTVAMWLDGVAQRPWSVGGPHTVFDPGTPWLIGQRGCGAVPCGSFYWGDLDEVAVYDRVLPDDRIVEHHRAGVEGFGAAVPISRARPTVSGAAQAGRTATCDEGEWSGGPREFEYRWLRSGRPIPDATERTYPLSSDDYGHDVTCDVVARTSAGTSVRMESANAIAMPALAPAGTYAEEVLRDEPTIYLPLKDVSDGATPNLGSDGGEAVLHADAAPAEGLLQDGQDRSARLDGWEDHLEIRPRAGRSLAGRYTVEGWVNVDWFHPFGSILFNDAGGITIHPGLIGGPNAGVPTALFEGIGPGWHHLVLRVTPHTWWERGYYEVFADGSYRGTQELYRGAPYWVLYDDEHRLRFGSNCYSCEGVHGRVDEAAVYPYKLSTARIAAHHRAGAPDTTPRPPASTAAPSVAGRPAPGRTLSCDPGRWSGGPTGYEFRWTRDGAAVAEGVDYAVQGGDVGARLACEVRATGAGGVSDWVASASVEVDDTPPVVTLRCPPTVIRGATAEATFSANDAGSGLAGPASGTVALDTTTAGIRTASVTAEDRAGLTATATCTYRVLFGRPTAPRVTAGAVPSADGAFTLGWDPAAAGEPDPAGFRLEATDADDAAWTEVARPATRSHAFSGAAVAEGTWRYRVRADDPAFDPGPSEESAPVVVDRTAPRTPEVRADRPPEHVSAAGERFYRDRVTLSVADRGDPDLADASPGSGVDPGSVPADRTLAENGTLTGGGTVRDRAGNASAAATPLTVRVDATPPALSVTCPAATVQLGRRASVAWTASDGESGLAGAGSGTFLAETGTAGDHEEVVDVRDRVGHVTRQVCRYRVLFDWRGFDRPLNEDPWVNVAVAGTVVPVRFDLRGDHGLAVLEGGAPVVLPAACPAGAREDAVEETLPAGTEPVLRYDAAARGYRYPLAVDPAWAGSCRRVELRLADGTTRAVLLRVP